uniref:C2H2-type domain-containing protein n=2 Tax=Biomphalaria glabrata TaxID=6526 RepID=A0A2C9M2V4_BIOGL
MCSLQYFIKMERSQGLRVCYYILYDFTEEVFSEMKIKLKDLSRRQLETLICVLSREIGRLEQYYSTCLTNNTNSAKSQIEKDERNNILTTFNGEDEESNSSNEASGVTVFDNDIDSAKVLSLLELKAAKEGLTITEDRTKSQLDVIHTKDGQKIYSKSWINTETSVTARKSPLKEGHLKQNVRKHFRTKVEDQYIEPQQDVRTSHIESGTAETTETICPIKSEDNNDWNANSIQTLEHIKHSTLGKLRSSFHLSSRHMNHLQRKSNENTQKCQRSSLTCTKPKIVCCDLCNRTFHTNHLLKEHLRTVHNQSQPTRLCPYCGKLVLHSRLKKHLEKVHEKPTYSCHLCSRSFLKRECLEGHLNKHANTKPYVCEVCGRKYTYSTSLSSHKKHCAKSVLPPHLQQSKSREDKTMLHVCEVCGRTFEGMSGLKDHHGAKHSSRIQTCCHCGKSFHWRPSYNRHVRTCKQRSDEERAKSIKTSLSKLFTCECGKQYLYRQSFRRHQKTCLRKQQLESYVLSSSTMKKMSLSEYLE